MTTMTVGRQWTGEASGQCVTCTQHNAHMYVRMHTHTHTIVHNQTCCIHTHAIALTCLCAFEHTYMLTHNTHTTLSLFAVSLLS